MTEAAPIVEAPTDALLAEREQIVPVRIFGCSTQVSASVLLEALSWINTTHPAGVPGVVNTSLGGHLVGAGTLSRAGALTHPRCHDVGRRRATSAAAFEPGVPVAYVATGLDFADALAAGPVGAPVLLARPSCVPNSVLIELERLVPDEIVVLGGASAMSDEVLKLTPCSPVRSGGCAPTTPAPSPSCVL